MSDSNTEQKYTCHNCNYSAKVAGKRYYELEWQFHIGTRKCNSCHRLFDNVVTKNVTQEEINVHTADYDYKKPNHKELNVWDEINEYAAFVETIEGKEKKKVNCRWCGTSENEVWHKEKPVCPKCNSQMSISKGEELQFENVEHYNGFEEMNHSAMHVVAFFTEPSCSICRHMQLIILEIEKEQPNEFKFIEFEYQYAQDNNLIHKYKLEFFPTFLIFKEGKYVGKFSNVESKPELLKKLRKRYTK